MSFRRHLINIQIHSRMLIWFGLLNLPQAVMQSRDYTGDMAVIADFMLLPPRADILLWGGGGLLTMA